MEHKYLVMKLGYIKGVDFYKEHTKVIEEYGYVDFARTGRRVINFSFLTEPFFYIKENAQCGNRIFKAYVLKDSLGEKRIPDYYNKLSLGTASWVRLDRIEIVDKDRFLTDYTLRNGNEIKALDRGAIPFFYVIKKGD